MSLVTSPGLLLRQHDYSESSRILRFLTPRMGVVAVIARGVRRRSARGEEPIQIFGEGTITFSHRADRDLHTLTDFEPLESPAGLRGYRRFAAASLIAELILVHSMEEGDPELYDWLRSTLTELGRVDEADLAGRLLAGAWRTLGLLGFPPELEHCVRCGTRLLDALTEEGEFHRLDIPAGGLVCPDCAGAAAMPRVGPVARHTLAGFVRGETVDELRAVGSHLSILEAFALHHLAPSRRLVTFESARRALGGAGADEGFEGPDGRIEGPDSEIEGPDGQIEPPDGEVAR